MFLEVGWCIITLYYSNGKVLFNLSTSYIEERDWYNVMRRTKVTWRGRRRRTGTSGSDPSNKIIFFINQLSKLAPQFLYYCSSHHLLIFPCLIKGVEIALNIDELIINVIKMWLEYHQGSCMHVWCPYNFESYWFVSITFVYPVCSSLDILIKDWHFIKSSRDLLTVRFFVLILLSVSNIYTCVNSIRHLWISSYVIYKF